MKESALQQQIRKALKCLVFKMEPPPVGVPDLLVVYAPGKHIWLEVKTPTGKVTPKQKAYHEKLRKQGERVYVVRSKEEAISIVQASKDSCSEDITTAQNCPIY